MEIPSEVSVGYSDMCFACGQKNPCGLKLKFNWDGKQATSEFTPTENHQGWENVIHGGILITLMDEAMAYAIGFEGIAGITATMQVRLRKPVAVGEKLLISARVTKKGRRLAETEAQLTLTDGSVVAEVKAVQYVSQDEFTFGYTTDEAGNSIPYMNKIEKEVA
ncbi:MAG: PaaI family thioesterase [Dehalococcoidales bacterium]|nr:PaaI family thioesterase [Dehalococcoidales bacterium]